MKIIKVKDLVLILNFIDQESIDLINNYAEQNTWKSETDNKNYYEESKDPHYNMQIASGEALSRLNLLKDNLKKQIEKLYECTLADENVGTLIKYKTGFGLVRHYDSDSANDIGKDRKNCTPSGHPSRDISSIMYFTDEFSGGVIHFPNIEFSYEPVKGSVIIFPSSKLYEHEVSILENGDRIMSAAFWHVLQYNSKSE
jgi:hypothetical protein